MNCNKSLTTTEQTHFFSHQLQAMSDEYAAYLHGYMNQHVKNKEAFLGKIVGFDDKRANLLIEFQGGFTPRLEFLYQGCVFSGIEGDVDELVNWSFSVQSFYKKNLRASSELFSVFNMPSNTNNTTILGFREVDTNFLEMILPLIKGGKKISIAIIQNPPPYKYLINLKNFVENNVDNYLLNLTSSGDISRWKPKILPKENRVGFIETELERLKDLIIQGPPGTGKSQLISQIANRFLEKNQSVCITALTNKTLIEVCTKIEIKKACLASKVYKTSLKENERIDAPGLKLVEKPLQITKGQLLLSTFYALSEAFSEKSHLNVKLFDVLIIEEASQAFSPTIAAFKLLANKVLLVGDPMQMPPIVLKKEQLIEINKNYELYIAGLTSMAVNTDVNAYLLNETYRLSTEAAKQTGVFYNNRLLSHQQDSEPLKIISKYQAFISPSKGSQKYCGYNLEYPDQLQEAVSLIIKLMSNLMKLNPKSTFAILAPYKKLVSKIQHSAAVDIGSTKNLTIETVDRIQGITVDFCILILPLKRVSFELNKERFNVATSRSRNGTLIFINDNFKYYDSVSPEVRLFLNEIKTVNKSD